MPEALRPAAFLDRDGTIIEDRDYLGDPAGVTLLPGAADAIRRLNEAGFPVVIITNQSGIGRGYFTRADYDAVAARLGAILARAGARADATYFCPHAPDQDPPCECRKPRPGLYERAARELGLDLARSLYVGDRVRDVIAGTSLGGRGYVIGGHSGDGPIPSGAERVEDLAEAVERYLARAEFD